MGEKTELQIERWAELSSKYRAGLVTTQDARFAIGRLAIHLQSELVKACGCDNDHVHHFHYEFGSVPDHDRSERVENGWASIASTDEGWAFGMGVLLEVAPTAYPKTHVIWPIEVKITGGEYVITSAMFSGEMIVRGDAEHYATDLKQVAEEMFVGLRSALDSWVDGKPTRSVGFVGGDSDQGH